MFYTAKESPNNMICLDTVSGAVYVISGRDRFHAELSRREKTNLEIILRNNGSATFDELFQGIDEYYESSDGSLDSDMWKNNIQHSTSQIKNAVEKARKKQEKKADRDIPLSLLERMKTKDPRAYINADIVVQRSPELPYIFLHSAKNEKTALEEYKRLISTAREDSDAGIDFSKLDSGKLSDKYIFPKFRSISNGYSFDRLLAGTSFKRLIVAPAGFGKTSFLKLIMLWYIGQGEGFSKELGADGDYLVIFVQASKANLRDEAFRLLDLAAFSDIVCPLVSDKRLLILIDGYDEIDSLSDDGVNHTGLFDSSLRSFTETYPNASILATSRFDAPAFRGFEHITLESFDDGMIKRYLENEVAADASKRRRAYEIIENPLFRSLASSPFCLAYLIDNDYPPALSIEYLCNKIIERRIQLGGAFGLTRDEIKAGLACAAFGEIFTNGGSVPNIKIDQRSLNSYFTEAARLIAEDSYEVHDREMRSFARSMPVRSGILAREPRQPIYSFSCDRLIARYLACYELQCYSRSHGGIPVASAVTAQCDEAIQLSEDMLGALVIQFFLSEARERYSLLRYILARGLTSVSADEQTRIAGAMEKDILDNSSPFGKHELATDEENAVNMLLERLKQLSNM